MSAQDEIRHEITQKIINGLKANKIPWRKPWNNDPNAGTPANVISKRYYSGINNLILNLTSMTDGYISKYWATYDQWKELGGQVRKRPENVPVGSWGTKIVFYRIFEKKKIEDGNEKIVKYSIMKTYTVFNVEQVYEIDPKKNKLDKYKVIPSEEFISDWKPAENVIESVGAKIIYGGNKAYYVRPAGTSDGDFIRMPNKNQFPEISEYYVTHFHELAHFMEVRLGWTGSYEMGELIAEMTASYLAIETNVPNLNLDNHIKYLESWLKHMENDPKWIFQVATQATKVADAILAFSQQLALSEEAA